jgi:protein involved in polysaccharide export with SLBB domain
MIYLRAAAAAIVLLTAVSASAQSGDRPQNPKEPPRPPVKTTQTTSGNPLLQAVNPDTRPVPSRRPTESEDFVDDRDPKSARNARAKDAALKLYGLDYFESSRQLIQARRLMLKELLSRNAEALTGTESPKMQSARGDGQRAGAAKAPQPRLAGPTMPSRAEIDAVRELKPGERLDLLTRKRSRTLTEEETERYRLLLSPSTLDPNRPPSDEELMAVMSLSEQQQLDLVLRQQQGTLSDADKRLYRIFLYPTVMQEIDPSQLDDPAALLTPAKRRDLVKRDREGRLTAEEKHKYRNYLQDPDAFEETLRGGAPFAGASRPLGSSAGTGSQLPADAGSVDAFREIADPLSSIFRRVMASPPANYQITPGDRLILRYWSPTQEPTQTTLSIDSTGGMTLPKGGRIVLRGLTVAQAEAAIHQRLRNVVKDAQVSLEIGELHSIRVTVTGESYYPGTYTVPATATAINLLLATGGPNDNGSLRRIEVRRAGKVVATLDVYQLLNGGTAQDAQLENDDILHVTARAVVVAVGGEVRRPALFELLENETLADALRYAGGVKASGVSQRVQVSTVTPGSARVLKDVDTAKLAAVRVPLYDGDQVDVFSLRTELANKVTIEGAVDQPGDYELTTGMRVSDLIARARGLLNEAYPTRADLYRYNPDATETLIPIRLDRATAANPEDNPVLQRWDRLKIYSVADVAWAGRREVTVKGAIRNPGTYYRAENMRVKDLLLAAGGTTPEAYMNTAVLLHQRPDGTFRYDYVDLVKAFAEDPQHNVPLEERDVLAVYRSEEARFAPERTVRILGDVVAPGTYPRGEQMRLSDLLRISGGRTAKAGDRAHVAHSRVNIGAEPTAVALDPVSGMPNPDPVLQDGDIVTIQGRGQYLDRAMVVTVEGAVNRPGPVILRGNNVRLSEVIKLAGGLKEEAYPEGLEFRRAPEMLASAGQKQTAMIVSQLNDLLNQSEYRRELGKSDIDRIKALGGVARDNAAVPVPGLGGLPAAPSIPSSGSLFQRDLVTPARTLGAAELTPLGNVIVDLAAAIRRPGGQEDIVMTDGDRLVVPEKPTTVQVIGAVIRPNSIAWKPGAPVGFYVENSAGYAPDAAEDRVLVIRVNGGMIPARKVKQILPGDVILVPTKVLAAKLQTRNNELQGIVTSVTNSVLVFFFAKRLLGL